ncbi:MAG TPA: hypothetical protein VGJ05_07755 [Fimbriiglobus sp.]|jgi:hypothetical protein
MRHRTLFVFFLTAFPGLADDAKSEWVYPGPDGKLVYKKTARGDRIMDFSHAGYMGGGVAIPDVPVRRTVKPAGGEDDAAAIQSALDAIAALPLKDGFRGAVLLAPGTYSCSRPITIPASGVVLQGSGSGAKTGGKSTIKLTGTPHPALVVRRTKGGPQGTGFAPTQTHLTDAYVPSGTNTFTVADATGFAVGDTVAIRRSVTDAWIKFMQMDDLVRDGKSQTWLRAGSTQTAERTIAAINGNTIAVSVPLADSYDAKYLNPPGTAVVKIRPWSGLTQFGIEHLHVESPPQSFNHTQPHFTAMQLTGQDYWVRDVAIDETMNSITVTGKRVTLQNVSVTRKAMHQGSSKPSEISPNASQCLVDRCSVTGDNVWFTATGSNVSGPVVILNCNFQGKSRAESHMRWSTGILYDGCKAPAGGIEIRNRGSMGSGHGWSMGWGVVWNCEAKDFLVQTPPGSMNWLIGGIGRRTLAPRPFGKTPNLPEGTVDSPGRPVTPRSLYLEQLAERLGPRAVKNIGY